MATTARGHIEQLPSGSFRVHVYAGIDPVTGKPRRLKQTCPDEASAAAALGKLLAQADGDHFPNREATLGQALAKYLEVADLEVSTREAHQGYIRRTIGPVLGEVKIRKLGADSLDSLYTALKKCSRLCRRLPCIEHYADGEHACDARCGPLRDHRTTRPHACDDRCRLHVCRPMKPATILRVHSIISSALDLAVRTTGPTATSRRTPARRTRASANRIRPARTRPHVCSTWSGPRTMSSACTYGPRSRPGHAGARSAPCARTGSTSRASRSAWPATTWSSKASTSRRLPRTARAASSPLDLLTCELFQERFQRRRTEARALGVQVPEDAFAFSPDPVGREPWNPDTMTHRYRRYARRVGITSSLKELRHYSATQLLAAGTDLNTVAGRLGHAEGSTTLKFYAQFTRPADQAAATVIPSQLDGLRKKERLRELYRQHMPPSGADELTVLASVIGPQVGLDEHTTFAWLTEFASADQG